MNENNSDNNGFGWTVSSTAAALANSAHFENALSSSNSLSASQLAQLRSDVATASNYNAVKFGLVSVAAGAMQNGLNGALNAGFATLLGTLAGSVGGPAAGALVAGSANAFLDWISQKTHELNVGGELYDLQEQLRKL